MPSDTIEARIGRALADYTGDPAYLESTFLGVLSDPEDPDLYAVWTRHDATGEGRLVRDCGDRIELLDEFCVPAAQWPPRSLKGLLG